MAATSSRMSNLELMTGHIENILRGASNNPPEDLAALVMQIRSLSLRCRPQGGQENASPGSRFLSNVDCDKDNVESSAAESDVLTAHRLLLDWVQAAQRCAVFFRHCHSPLVDAFLSCPWPYFSKKLEYAMRTFVDNLASSQAYFVHHVLRYYITCFNFDGQVFGTKINTFTYFTSIHSSVIRILEIAPSATAVLVEFVASAFPHRRLAPSRLKTFFSNVLQMYSYLPVMRESLMSILMEHLLLIDADIQKHIDELPGVKDHMKFLERMEAVKSVGLYDNFLDSAKSIANTVRVSSSKLLPCDDDNFNNSDLQAGSYSTKINSISSGQVNDLRHLLNSKSIINEIPAGYKNQGTNNAFANELSRIDADEFQNDSENDDENYNTFDGDEIEEVYDNNGPHITLEMSENALAYKLDCLMDVILRFVSTLEHDEEIIQTTRVLLRVFDKQILRTYRSRRVQFVLFYVLSLGSLEIMENSCDEFLGLLMDTFLCKNEQQAALVRVSAALYIASFVARATYVNPNLVEVAAKVFASYCVGYVDKNEKVAVRPDAKRYPAFYAAVQALMYIFCFRHDIFDSEKAAVVLKGFERVINSRFNPLKVLSQTVVDAFARRTNHLGVLMCYPIIHRNARFYLANWSMFGGADADAILEFTTYFPFDPPALSSCNVYFDPVYRQYSPPTEEAIATSIAIHQSTAEKMNPKAIGSCSTPISMCAPERESSSTTPLSVNFQNEVVWSEGTITAECEGKQSDTVEKLRNRDGDEIDNEEMMHNLYMQLGLT